MINPSDITKYDRTEAELEEFLLFCILVAGKNSKVQANKLDSFLNERFRRGYDRHSPFEFILGLIYDGYGDNCILNCVMKDHKLGQYSRLEKCFTQLVKPRMIINLKTCSVSDLEAISGIGQKTSRFFLMHSRSNQYFAVLDTHILKWLNAHGVSAPKATPSSKNKYKYLSDKWMELSAIQYPNLTPSERDLLVWKEYSQRA